MPLNKEKGASTMILNRDLIKKSEESAVLSGAFSFKDLMKRAGVSAAEIINEKFPCQNKKVAVVCGNGNNGGDGFVIADYLFGQGADVTVITPMGMPTTENAKHYFGELKFVKFADKFDKNENFDIIIDAVFGIGLNRPISNELEVLFKSINDADAIRVSVDIPSGVDCDNGKVYGEAVKSDLTVTFIAYKPCFFLPEGSDYCGEVVVADISVKAIDYTFELIKKPIFEKRRHNAHKGDFGTALIMAGSYGMAGAAVLATKAALRSGLGIAKCVIPKNIYTPFTVSIPEAVCLPQESEQYGGLSKDIDIKLVSDKCNALLFGCGVGKSEDIKLLLEKLFKDIKIPMIIDADGLNVLSENIDILKESISPVILTPHPAEMARLCGITTAEVESDRVGIASRFAKEYGCILVLKGADTIIADQNGKVFFNKTGNPGMATGGSGDVLAGMIVSLLSQGFSPIDAAKSAVYLHGEAGDKAALKLGERKMLPSDIIDFL